MRYFLIILTLPIIVSIHANAQTDSLGILIDSFVQGQAEKAEIIDPVETMPEFPGGQDSLRAFIERNNNWQVGQETIKGKVFVGFVVEQDGSITHIEIVRGLHESCNKEARRIVSVMPKWKPGEFRGKRLRTKMILPITFDGMK